MKSKRIYGEANLVDTNVLIKFSDRLKEKISEYEERNIFNCDETGLMYKQTNKRTYTFTKDENTSGKFSKERITILFCVSKNGERL
jgi:hypothetical protein